MRSPVSVILKLRCDQNHQEDLLTCRGPNPRASDSIGLGWTPRIRVSTRLGLGWCWCDLSWPNYTWKLLLCLSIGLNLSLQFGLWIRANGSAWELFRNQGSQTPSWHQSHTLQCNKIPLVISMQSLKWEKPWLGALRKVTFWTALRALWVAYPRSVFQNLLSTYKFPGEHAKI